MLRNSFIHLPQIGIHTEQQLWKNDIICWEDFLQKKNALADRFHHSIPHIKLSKNKLLAKDALFFTKRLRTDQHWRIFQNFQSVTAYLDIETTGLSRPNDHITTISLYDGTKIFYYIHGKNLKKFVDDIKKFKVLVTYNGKCFDIPFIEHEFGISIPQAHLDLRFILRSLGISGGLKSCEHQLGLSRGELEGVDGYFAVHLWKDYLAGNEKALDTLLAYNITDTVNLEKLMIIAYNKKIAQLSNILNVETIKTKKYDHLEIPFEPDNPTIKRIKTLYY